MKWEGEDGKVHQQKLRVVYLPPGVAPEEEDGGADADRVSALRTPPPVRR
jgi:hypothetical protein